MISIGCHESWCDKINIFYSSELPLSAHQFRFAASFAAASAVLLNASSATFSGTSIISRCISLYEPPVRKPFLRVSASSSTSLYSYEKAQSPASEDLTGEPYHHKGPLRAEYRVTFQPLIACEVPCCGEFSESRGLNHEVQMIWTHIVSARHKEQLSDRTLAVV